MKPSTEHFCRTPKVPQNSGEPLGARTSLLRTGFFSSQRRPWDSAELLRGILSITDLSGPYPEMRAVMRYNAMRKRVMPNHMMQAWLCCVARLCHVLHIHLHMGNLRRCDGRCLTRQRLQCDAIELLVRCMLALEVLRDALSRCATWDCSAQGTFLQ